MGVRFGDSYKKNLSQLAVVASEPFTVNGAMMKPPSVLKLSETFWQKYGCYLGCGGCCFSFSLDYTPEEYERLKDPRVKEGARRYLFLSMGEIGRSIHTLPKGRARGTGRNGAISSTLKRAVAASTQKIHSVAMRS